MCTRIHFRSWDVPFNVMKGIDYRRIRMLRFTSVILMTLNQHYFVSYQEFSAMQKKEFARLEMGSTIGTDSRACLTSSSTSKGTLITSSLASPLDLLPES